MTLSGSWRKSTKSGANGDCVEVRQIGDSAQLRDSKDPGGPVLSFDTAAFAAFVESVKANRS